VEISEVFFRQKQKKAEHFTPTIGERKAMLRKLRAWIVFNRENIIEAVFRDFRKPETETVLTEIKVVLAEIDQALKNLKQWMAPKKVKGDLIFLGTKSIIYREPAGVVLILAPWNFPFNLTVGPLVSAIAAGNSVIIKPSEYTGFTTALMERMAGEIFSPDDVFVIPGGPEIAEELIRLPFDHIFFTGSPETGKKVMKAAAEHLATVTLELGGQNPLIIHESADLEDAARKIIYGKCINAGQSCLSPNCLYIPEQLLPQFTAFLKKAFGNLYGNMDLLKSNPDFGRIISERHFDRLNALVEDARISGASDILCGIPERAERFMPLTVLLNPGKDSKILNDEIFGPLLPVVTYQDLRKLYAELNHKPVPLAAYFFGRSGKREFMGQVRSGTAVINDTTLHFIHPGLPFGGKGFSGIGKAHGFAGFLSFSHERPLLQQRRGFTTARLVYPPYTKSVKRFVEIIYRWL
jgi:aldehyde dehydrogenase (NAD+)